MKSDEEKFLVISVAAYLTSIEDFYFSPDILSDMMEEDTYRTIFRYDGDELVCDNETMLRKFVLELEFRELVREMETMETEGKCELMISPEGLLEYIPIGDNSDASSLLELAYARVKKKK